MDKLIVMKYCEARLEQGQIIIDLPAEDLLKTIAEMDKKNIQRKNLLIVLVPRGGKMQFMGVDMKVRV